MTSSSARLCSRQKAVSSSRWFSSSPNCRKHGSLITFPPTSSAELDEILSSLRNHVFLPAHLGRAHRQLVHKPSLHRYLTGDEPVKVTLRTYTPSSPDSREKAPHNLPGPPPKPGHFGPPINNKNKQSITLSPIDRFTDEPRTKPTVVRILDLMQTRSDFALLPDLFRELKISKRECTTAMVAKAVRKAADAGQIGITVEMFRRHDSTGLRINDPDIAREFVRGLIVRASAQGEWDEISVDKAIQNASTGFRMMDESRHLVSREPGKDARKLPEIVGSMMALVAIRANKFRGNKDADGLVRYWVKKTLSAKEGQSLVLGSRDEHVANQKLMDWAPVYVGSRLALEVLGDSAAESWELQKLVQDLEGLVKEAKAIIQEQAPTDKQRRGLIILDELQKLL